MNLNLGFLLLWNIAKNPKVGEMNVTSFHSSVETNCPVIINLRWYISVQRFRFPWLIEVINPNAMKTTFARRETNKTLYKVTILTGLVVGTLDIIAAIVHTLMRGGDPVIMFRFIASGVFGTRAFSGGAAFALYGLAFHYAIAMLWTILFFIIFARMNVLSRNTIVTGIGYGLFVWVMMTFVVLPLSNTPPLPFSIQSAVIGALILILAIGLPLSFSASRYHAQNHS